MVTPTPEQIAQWAMEHGELIFGTKSKESWVFPKQALENLVARAMAEQAEQDAKVCDRLWEQGVPGHAGDAASAIRANAPKVTT